MFDVSSMATTAPIMLVGWLGVFVVIGFVVGAVYLLQAVFSQKKDK